MIAAAVVVRRHSQLAVHRDDRLATDAHHVARDSDADVSRSVKEVTLLEAQFVGEVAVERAHPRGGRPRPRRSRSPSRGPQAPRSPGRERSAMKRRLGVERVERERVHAGHVVCLCDCLDRRHVRFSLTEPFEEVHGDNEPREPRRGDRDREVRAHVAQGGRVDPQRVAKSVPSSRPPPLSPSLPLSGSITSTVGGF